MEFNKIKESLLKEEWIDNIKYMTPRPGYNHIELQGELYLQLKDYFSKFGKTTLTRVTVPARNLLKGTQRGWLEREKK